MQYTGVFLCGELVNLCPPQWCSIERGWKEGH
jgi:hypothetical protein